MQFPSPENIAVIRHHFKDCIRPSVFKNNSSFDEIADYANAHQNETFQAHRARSWPRVSAIIRGLVYQEGSDWGHSPFESRLLES